MRVNDSEMSVRWNNEVWSIPEISDLWYRRIQTKDEKNSKREGFCLLSYSKRSTLPRPPWTISDLWWLMNESSNRIKRTIFTVAELMRIGGGSAVLSSALDVLGVLISITECSQCTRARESSSRVMHGERRRRFTMTLILRILINIHQCLRPVLRRLENVVFIVFKLSKGHKQVE